MQNKFNRTLVAVFVCVTSLPLLFVGCADPEQNVVTSTSSTTITSTKQTTTTTQTTTSWTATTTTTASFSKPTSTTTGRPLSGHQINGVPVMHQRPDYPTGCETISTIMVLNYWGESVTADAFIDNHLPMSGRFYWNDGTCYGPDPCVVFVGNPRSTQSYGCMAPVIEKALVSYFGTDTCVVNTTGTSMQELCDTYVNNDIPVLLWVTIGMIDAYISDQWYAEDGTKVEWPANEHCMVLVGYDEQNYYFNDPYTGRVKSYAKWLAEKRYREMGSQSIVITN